MGGPHQSLISLFRKVAKIIYFLATFFFIPQLSTVKAVVVFAQKTLDALSVPSRDNPIE